MLTVGSLFSGIGGLDLGLERAGMTVRWQVENDPYCCAVLEKYWPKVRRYGDITTLNPRDLDPVDLICGGFPCQPVSVAGKRLGQDDPRWLWPEFARIIRVLRPRYVLVENVPGLLVQGFGDVLGDLASSGYDAEWDCLPAAAVGAPHLRYRVFLVAYCHDQRQLQPKGSLGDERRWISDGGADVADADATGLEIRQGIFGNNGTQRPSVERSDRWSVEPDVGRVAHGVPARVDRLRALGNAVVPQVAEWVGRQILAFDQSLR